jgi:poly(hydroxyalkanoate) depolymerase family esterase
LLTKETMKLHDAFAARSAPRFDAGSITETINRALASAGLNTHTGPMKGVTDTIEQAFSAAGLTPRRESPRERGATIEGTAREVDESTQAAVEAVSPRPGEFLERSYTCAAGTRTYKVYIPQRYADVPDDRMPMVVMLHGCTQSPDDFAAGTRMNAIADEHGFVVVYPAQPASANAQKCWNWFRTEDQVHASGEPALIAGIVNEVAATYRIDERRIFVAGMSAGAAMAVILGTTYPDLFAAVGAHSGLPYGAAHDVPSAFGAMRGGGASPRGRPRSAPAVPTIVFHGDAIARSTCATPPRSSRRRRPRTARGCVPKPRPGARPAGAGSARSPTPTRRIASSSSIGRCTGAATRGRAEAPRDRTRTRAVRMPRTR